MKITFHKSSFQLTPIAQAEVDEVSARLADPQDLEDGLLCVAHDELMTNIAGALEKRLEVAILKVCGVSPSEDLPATIPQNPRW